jgi:hypothetical protein
MKFKQWRRIEKELKMRPAWRYSGFEGGWENIK